jgi:DnaJ-class molecular chaperone
LNPLETDHYAILGLDRRCTLAQIRAAYRLLAKRHHPDVNGGSVEATERAKALNEAHEVLSDPARRRAYDRSLSERATAARPAAGATKIERNISQDARLRIEDFLRGATLSVRVNDPANPGGPEVYELVVPPGTAPGTRFRLPRREPFAEGFVQVRVKVLPGFRFKARGSDLRCDLRIDARRAAQGGTEVMAGATGAPLRVSIPAGVARGAILRVPSEGLPKPRGGRGDLLVKITYRPEVRISRAASR